MDNDIISPAELVCWTELSNISLLLSVFRLGPSTFELPCWSCPEMQFDGDMGNSLWRVLVLCSISQHQKILTPVEGFSFGIWPSFALTSLCRLFILLFIQHYNWLVGSVQYSTVLYSTVRYGTVQYSAVLYCTVLYWARRRIMMVGPRWESNRKQDGAVERTFDRPADATTGTLYRKEQHSDSTVTAL